MKKLGYLAILAIPALSFAAGTGHHGGGMHHAQNVYAKGAMSMHATGPDYYTSIVDAVQHGTVNFNLRLRHETVKLDRDDTLNGRATTLRTLMTYQSAKFYGLSGMLQVSNNFRIGSKNFDDESGRDAETYAAIPDPSVTQFTQAYLNYNFGVMGANVRYGRQAISYDDGLLVGTENFRQTMQTFDALSFSLMPLPKLKLDFNYVTKVNATIGIDAPNGQGRLKARAQFYHASYNALKYVKVSAYDYNFENRSDPTVAGADGSTNTYGIRVHDKMALMANTSVMYAAEYDKQKQAHNNPVVYKANFWNVMLGAEWQGLSVALEQDNYSGNGTSSFQRALGDMHKFQGWADEFADTDTPANGLVDKSVTASYQPIQFKNLTLKAAYHKFDAKRGNAKFGTEWDAGVDYAVSKHLSLSADYANFKAKPAGLAINLAKTKQYFLSAIVSV